MRRLQYSLQVRRIALSERDLLRELRQATRHVTFPSARATSSKPVQTPGDGRRERKILRGRQSGSAAGRDVRAHEGGQGDVRLPRFGRGERVEQRQLIPFRDAAPFDEHRGEHAETCVDAALRSRLEIGAL